MNRVILAIVVIAGLGALLIGAGSCDKLKGIKGMVAGRIQTDSGQGVGYVSVVLVSSESGGEVDRMTAEDSGSFIFKEVTAGKYTIKVYTVTGDEIPADVEEFNLTPGRTLNVDVTVQTD